MFLFILFPILVLSLQCIILYNNESNIFCTYLSWRRSIITSILFYGLWVALITEFLSLFNAITFNGFLFSYILYFIFLLTLLIKNKLWNYKYSFSLAISNLSFYGKAVLLISILLLSYLLFAAIACPPNNWDSMTYHLPRVMHWIQNKNVNYYPTHHEFQNVFPPLAEYIILHWQVLTGNDYFSQVVQWTFMIGSCVGITLIVKYLGGNSIAEIWSFYLCISLPMGIYQSVSTQNDYVNSFFIICSIYYLLILFSQNKIIYYILFAISTGLAIKTKSTAYIFEAIPCLILAVLLLKEMNLKKIFLYSFCIGAIILFINAGNFNRNIWMYNNPFGISVSNYGPANSGISWKPVYSSLIKYTGYQLQSGIYLTDQFIINIVNGLHRIVDLEIGDPGISMTRVYIIPSGELLFHEDYVSNPIHFLLFLISSLILILNYRYFKPEMLIFESIVIGGIFLFSMYLKWWEFNNRLILPLLILSTAVSGILIDTVLDSIKDKYISISITYLLFIIITFNTIYKVIKCKNIAIFSKSNIFNTPRNSLYFNEREYLEQNYIKAVREVKKIGCDKIGLINNLDDWEYPFWILLKTFNNDVRIEGIKVKNKSSDIIQDNNNCIIIEFNNSKNFVETSYISK